MFISGEIYYLFFSVTGFYISSAFSQCQSYFIKKTYDAKSSHAYGLSPDRRLGKTSAHPSVESHQWGSWGLWTNELPMTNNPDVKWLVNRIRMHLWCKNIKKWKKSHGVGGSFGWSGIRVYDVYTLAVTSAQFLKIFQRFYWQTDLKNTFKWKKNN